MEGAATSPHHVLEDAERIKFYLKFDYDSFTWSLLDQPSHAE